MQTRLVDLVLNLLRKNQYQGTTPSDDELYLVTDDYGVTSADVINALGYTPYNATNPNGFINSAQVGNGTITLSQDNQSIGGFTTNQTNSKLIKLKGLYDYYVINATLRGSPTINEATVSGMSSNNWVTTAYTAPGVNEVFAISTQFVTDVPGDYDDEAQIIISDSFSTPNFALRIDGIASGVEDNLSVCVNGTWYNLSDTTILTGEVYQAKLINFMHSDGQTAAGTYLYVYSPSMDEVIYDGLVTSNTYSAASSVFYFGSGNNGAYPLYGSIDLSQTYIEQNDIAGGGTFDNGWYTVWTGATPIIDAKADKTDLNGKANTDLNNLIATASPNFDGQWVAVNETIAQSVTVSGSTSDATYNISSLLPNDSYNYECLIWCYAETAATSGKYMLINLYSDIITQYTGVCGGRTSANYAVYCDGNIILPVGTGRTVTVLGQTSSNFAGTYTLKLTGYRRIGTNQ